MRLTRERQAVFLLAWRDLSSYTVASHVAGLGMSSQVVPIGTGIAHAVPRDGDRYTAVCGRFVRMWSYRRWSSSSFEELCPDCERALLVGRNPASSS
jgi:hypothetical protein